MILQTCVLITQVLVCTSCGFSECKCLGGSLNLKHNHTVYMLYEIKKWEWFIYSFGFLKKIPAPGSRYGIHRWLSSVEAWFPGSSSMPIGILLWTPSFRWTKVVSAAQETKSNGVSHSSPHHHDGQSAEWELTLDLLATVRVDLRTGSKPSKSCTHHIVFYGFLRRTG